MAEQTRNIAGLLPTEIELHFPAKVEFFLRIHARVADPSIRFLPSDPKPVTIGFGQYFFCPIQFPNESVLIEIHINGKPETVTAGTNLTELSERLELRPNVIAIEVNGQLIPREQHAVTELRPGDVIEIVSLVGGG